MAINQVLAFMKNVSKAGKLENKSSMLPCLFNRSDQDKKIEIQFL